MLTCCQTLIKNISQYAVKTRVVTVDEKHHTKEVNQYLLRLVTSFILSRRHPWILEIEDYSRLRWWNCDPIRKHILYPPYRAILRLLTSFPSSRAAIYK